MPDFLGTPPPPDETDPMRSLALVRPSEPDPADPTDQNDLTLPGEDAPPADWWIDHRARFAQAPGSIPYVWRIPERGGRQAKGLLYDGEINTIASRPGIGKTFLAMEAIRETLVGGGEHARVLWWNFDSSLRDLGIRFELMDLMGPVMSDDDNFRLVQGPLPATDLVRAVEWVASGDGFVVIDTVESAGCPGDGNQEGVSKWWNYHVAQFHRRGACVLLLDHVPKNVDVDESRARGAIGSNTKLARVTGASYFLSGKPWTKSTPGEVRLVLDKDRPGDVGPIGQVAAVYKVSWHGDQMLRSLEHPASEEDVRNERMAELRSVLLEAGGSVSTKRALMRQLSGKQESRSALIVQAERDGVIVVETVGGKDVYKLPEE